MLLGSHIRCRMSHNSYDQTNQLEHKPCCRDIYVIPLSSSKGSTVLTSPGVKTMAVGESNSLNWLTVKEAWCV